jgi:hypothetical protein
MNQGTARAVAPAIALDVRVVDLLRDRRGVYGIGVPGIFDRDALPEHLRRCLPPHSMERRLW